MLEIYTAWLCAILSVCNVALYFHRRRLLSLPWQAHYSKSGGNSIKETKPTSAVRGEYEVN